MDNEGELSCWLFRVLYLFNIKKNDLGKMNPLIPSKQIQTPNCNKPKAITRYATTEQHDYFGFVSLYPRI